MANEDAVINEYLDTGNDLIGYKIGLEKEFDKEIQERVIHIESVKQYEKLEELIGEKDGETQKPAINSFKDLQDIRNALIDARNRTRREIVKNALEIACDKLKCQVAAIFLFSKDGSLKRVGIKGVDKEFKPIDANWLINEEEEYAIGESFTGRAAQTSGNSKYGRTQISKDFQHEEGLKFKKEYFEKIGKLQFAIAVPLNGRNKTYGVLRVINKVNSKEKTLLELTESDLALVSFLGGAIAAAISNFKRDQQSNILGYLRDSLTESLTGLNHPDFDHMGFYERVLEFLTSSETAFKAAILRTKNYSSQEMEVKYCSYSDSSVAKKEDKSSRRCDQGFVGLVTTTRKPQIVDKISRSGMKEKFIDEKFIDDNKFESFACLPLVVASTNEVVGTLSLYATYEYEFNSSSIDFLDSITSAIAALVHQEKQQEKIEQKFKDLANQWLTQTGFMSSTVEAAMHPSYQQIIGMGEFVIPLLLKELRKRSGRWFWALESITGENPVPENKRGKTKEMIKAWIEWGQGKGYITEVESDTGENPVPESKCGKTKEMIKAWIE
jgi:GAF domain-containing protein